MSCPLCMCKGGAGVKVMVGEVKSDKERVGRHNTDKKEI